MKGMKKLKILFPGHLVEGMNEFIGENYLDESALARAAVRDLLKRENSWPPHKKTIYDPTSEIKKLLIPNIYGLNPVQIMYMRENPNLVRYLLLDDEERGFNREAVVKKMGHNFKDDIIISIVRYWTKIGLLGFFEDKLPYEEKLRLYHALSIAEPEPPSHTYKPPKKPL